MKEVADNVVGALKINNADDNEEVVGVVWLSLHVRVDQMYFFCEKGHGS